MQCFFNNFALAKLCFDSVLKQPSSPNSAMHQGALFRLVYWFFNNFARPGGLETDEFAIFSFIFLAFLNNFEIVIFDQINCLRIVPNSPQIIFPGQAVKPGFSLSMHPSGRGGLGEMVGLAPQLVNN